MHDFAQLQEAFARVPVNRYLRLALRERTNDRCAVCAEILPEYTQEHGVVHGALVTAFADTAAVWLFHPELAEGHSMTSVEFKVNFLSPAFLDRGPLIAEAALVRRGRRIGVAQADVRQRDELILRGLFTYMFFQKSAPAV
ncbi:MAG TPA: PaaI family thioesterase [Phycisphaerae bacterium]|nr:PaaI family thioesterase [Phycisphaerae bacterium]